MKILVIDDVQENLKSASNLLTGHELTLAGDIDTAYKALQKQSFDIVLTDLNLPIAGSQHAQRVAAHRSIDETQEAPVGLVFAIKAANKGIPVVIVSDSDHHQDIFCSLLDLLMPYYNGERTVIDGRPVIEFQEARGVEVGRTAENRIIKNWSAVIKNSRLVKH